MLSRPNPLLLYEGGVATADHTHTCIHILHAPLLIIPNTLRLPRTVSPHSFIQFHTLTLSLTQSHTCSHTLSSTHCHTSTHSHILPRTLIYFPHTLMHTHSPIPHTLPHSHIPPQSPTSAHTNTPMHSHNDDTFMLWYNIIIFLNSLATAVFIF